jgi:hypothetical protein
MMKRSTINLLVLLVVIYLASVFSGIDVVGYISDNYTTLLIGFLLGIFVYFILRRMRD